MSKEEFNLSEKRIEINVNTIEDELRDDIKELKVKLMMKEQTISLLYNLVKECIFWRRE